MKLGKRIAALFLVFAMVFALAPPLSAFAETAETVPETSVPIETSTEASTDPTEGTTEATEETAAQATTSPTEETEATEVPEETTEATEGTEATEVPEETEEEETLLLAAANEEPTVLDDFLAIAAAQVGVTADEDGITIYDTWWDDTDDMSGDWTAKFVSYCLYEAGIEIIPYESDWGMLYTILSASNSTSQTYIYLDITYTPVVGDIVIWDTDGDGTADHGGIIAATDANGYTIIEGTANNMVEAVAYTDSTGIMGVIPVSEICGLSSISTADGQASGSGTETAEGGNYQMATGGTSPGSATGYYSFLSPGVVMQIVYHPYSSIASGAGGTVSASNTEEENMAIMRVNSYNNIVNLVQNYSDSYNSTTVYDGVTRKTVLIADTWTGRVYNLTDELTSSTTANLVLTYYSGSGRYCLNASYYANVSENLAGIYSGVGGFKSTTSITEYWSSGGTYYISAEVDMDSVGMSSVEKMLQSIIFGENSTSGTTGWGSTDDIGDIAYTSTGTRATSVSNDVSTYAQLLKYLGASDTDINNYLKAYNGELDANDNTLVPSIIWTACAFDTTVDLQQGSYARIPVYLTDTIANSFGISSNSVSTYKAYATNWRYYDSNSLANGKLISSPALDWYGTTISMKGALSYLSMPLDILGTGTSATTWWKTAFTNKDAAKAALPSHDSAHAANLFGTATSGGSAAIAGNDSTLFGVHTGASYGALTTRHNYPVLGTGMVNRINATGVDDGSTLYYMRGYWTPYGYDNGTEPLVTKVSFTLQKSSASTSAVGASISGNSNYSLAGAKYGVYVNGTLMETLTTDSTGKATSSLTYAVGTTVTIKETAAPTGYSLDNTTYTFTIQSSGNTFSVSDTPITKQFTLQKTIAGGTTVQNEISGNGMYSLAGAKYQVLVNNQVVETLTTDSTGKATSTKYYTLGTTITVKETVAPTGYKLDNTEYTFTIVNGTNTFSVSDEPVFDPPFAITKVDASTTTAQGNSSFSGAVFKFEYFANSSWSGTATRTWYFKTDADGYAAYDASYLASGYTSDALYVDGSGNYKIPLGTVKITEVVNSLGYIVLPDSLYCSIVEDASASDGVKVVWKTASLQYITDMSSGNYEKYGIYEPADEPLYGSLTVQKSDSVLGTALPDNISFAGCEFAVYNMSTNSVKIGNFDVAENGEVCYTFGIDDSGSYSTGAIFPIGTYKVVETKGNEYYEVNSSWSYEFTVTGATTTAATSFSATCTNTATPGEISILKTDTSTNALAGAKFLLEWSQDGATWTAVTSTQGLGYCSSADLVDGTLTSGTDGKVTFTGLHPGLQYRLTEVEAPNGYSLLTDTAWEGLLTDWDDYTVSLRVVNSEVYTLPAAGSSGLWLYPFIGTASMLAIAVYLVTRKKRATK